MGGKVFLISIFLILINLAFAHRDFLSSKITPEVMDDDIQCENLNGTPRSDYHLFKYLTNPVRYDRIHPPENYDENGKKIPLEVHIRSYIYYLQNLDTIDLQFKIQKRFQIRYHDSRLKFSEHCSNRTEPLIGEEDLKKEIWMPHLYFVNEKGSNVLGTHSKDILVSISPDGTVIVSIRMQLTLYCSMNFQKFPFDQQECQSTISSWKIKASEVKLLWERESPFVLGTDKILTEYEVTDTSLYETSIDAKTPDFQFGDFLGNYSVIIFKIKLKRQVGCYLLEYYFPSMLIIATSWISFWLQADASPPRTMLGMTSMLTFITLSTSQTRSLPKVSYIKVSEVWFIAGTLFIFASLVEFAFSNLIWRRKKLLDIDKVNTKNLLMKTIIPRSGSSFCLNKDGQVETIDPRHSANNLTLSVPDWSNNHYCVKIPENPENSEKPQDSEMREHHLYTHHQVSILIDRRARVAFPMAFLIFNIFYWTYVAF